MGEGGERGWKRRKERRGGRESRGGRERAGEEGEREQEKREREGRVEGREEGKSNHIRAYQLTKRIFLTCLTKHSPTFSG